ncbi:MAG: MT-A70 family methyltransferase, partial [Chloroflexota bacterium]|nr:MT-A70 family methyltransferase [Chloroflexota bacterium]
EYVLLGMRGHIKRITTDPISQVLFHPRLGHSEKPPIVRDHLVTLFGDLTRVELFARNTSKGWDVFGDEVEGSIDLA